MKNQIVTFFFFWLGQLAFFLMNFMASQKLEVVDYGYYSIILAVLMFGIRFTEVGIGDYYIIEGEKNNLGTVFKVNLIKGFIIAGGVLFSSFYIEAFYGSQEVAMIIGFSSIIFILESLKNPMIYQYYKDRYMAKIIWVEKGSYSISLLIGLGLIIIYKSLWVLLITYVLYFFLQVVFSYIWISKPSFRGFNKGYSLRLLKFSKHILWFIILTYSIRQGMDLIVPKLIGIHTFAVYSFTFLIGVSPTNFIIYPLNKLLFPIYANSTSNKELSILFNKVICQSAYILVFLSLAIWFLIPMFLERIGHTELLDSNLLKYMLIYGVIRGMTANLGVVYKTLNKQKIYNRILLLEAIVIFFCLVFWGGTSIGILCSMGAAILVHLILGLLFLNYSITINYINVIKAIVLCTFLLLFNWNILEYPGNNFLWGVIYSISFLSFLIYFMLSMKNKFNK